jgi:cell wall-associated NlpC family hydrolase
MSAVRFVCAALVLLGSVLLVAQAPAHAAVSRAAAEASYYGGSAAGNAALDWAEGHAAGCWYSYGGTGCYPGYDCSGLVMEAFAHGAGITLPRTTYAMLGSRHLHWVPASQARRGDLAFYGPGHVEINTVWYRMTFGAHDSGSRVGWIREWMEPTFYRVY